MSQFLNHYDNINNNSNHLVRSEESYWKEREQFYHQAILPTNENIYHSIQYKQQQLKLQQDQDQKEEEQEEEQHQQQSNRYNQITSLKSSKKSSNFNHENIQGMKRYSENNGYRSENYDSSSSYVSSSSNDKYEAITSRAKTVTDRIYQRYKSNPDTYK